MKTILVIGAHPDDIEIDCAGTIAQEIQDGNCVLLYILTYGEKVSDPKVRREEALESGKLLGVQDVIFEGLSDCSLRYDSSLVGRVISKIRSIKPERVYAHCARDISPDHAEVGKAAILASRGVPEIFAYRGSPQWTGFSPTYFVDIEKFLDTKDKVLQIFASQNAQDRFGLDYVIANAVYYGRMANCGIRYAEAFEVVRMAR